jgi:hypothetical protein
MRLLRLIFGLPAVKGPARAPNPDDYSHVRPRPGRGNWHGLSNGEWMCGDCGGLGTWPSSLTGREIACGNCRGRPYR